MHVCGTHNLIGDDGDALHDFFRQFSAFDGITFSIFQQEVGLEENEVGLVCRYIFFELLCIVLSGKTVRVITIWQKENLYIHAFSQEHVCAASGCMNAGFVAVVE